MRFWLSSTLPAIAVSLFLATPLAAIEPGEAKGVLITNGDENALKFAWAKMAPNEYEESQGAEDLVVLLASKPLREGLLDDYAKLFEPAKAGEIDALVLTISGDRVSSVQIYNDVFSQLGSGSSSIVLEKISEADGVVEYRARLIEPEEFFDRTWAFDVHFKAPVGQKNVFAASPAADKALAARTTGLPEGGAKGTFVVDGVTHEIEHVYAYSERNPFDEKKKDTFVVLSNIPVTPEQASDQSALVKLVDSGKLHALRVKIDDQEEPASVLALSGELGAMVSGNRLAAFDPIRFNDEEIEGTLKTREEKEFMGHTYAYEVSFRVSVQPSGKPGDFHLDASNATALPKEGGEVGKAWLAQFQAVEKASSLRELKKLGLDIPEEALDDPEADVMLELVKAMRPEQVRVTEGFSDGKRATLNIEGRERETGDRTVGTIKMVRENGQWVSVSESWSTEAE